MDLRNFELKKLDKLNNSIKITIVDNIKLYLQSNKVNVCKLIISSDSPLDNIKSEILNNQDIDVTTIKKFGEYKDNIINKEYEYLDISPKGINKNSALKILEDYLKISNNEVMAIGDNLNDLDMIKNSGIGVSVANGYDELKQVAKFVTSNPVEKGGFAEAIYKFIKF